MIARACMNRPMLRFSWYNSWVHLLPTARTCPGSRWDFSSATMWRGFLLYSLCGSFTPCEQRNSPLWMRRAPVTRLAKRSKPALGKKTSGPPPQCGGGFFMFFEIFFLRFVFSHILGVPCWIVGSSAFFQTHRKPSQNSQPKLVAFSAAIKLANRDR